MIISEIAILLCRIYENVCVKSRILSDSEQLLPVFLVDSADYHPEKELFTDGNARGK